jgi:hypothetical protein
MRPASKPGEGTEWGRLPRLSRANQRIAWEQRHVPNPFLDGDNTAISVPTIVYRLPSLLALSSQCGDNDISCWYIFSICLLHDKNPKHIPHLYILKFWYCLCNHLYCLHKPVNYVSNIKFQNIQMWDMLRVFVMQLPYTKNISTWYIIISMLCMDEKGASSLHWTRPSFWYIYYLIILGSLFMSVARFADNKWGVVQTFMFQFQALTWSVNWKILDEERRSLLW